MQNAEHYLRPQPAEDEVIFKRARAGDGEGILRVHQEAFVQGYARLDGKHGANEDALKDLVYKGEFAGRRRQYWEQEANRERVGLWVARLACSGEIIGFGEAQDGENEFTAEINGMYISPIHQKRGYGRKLLEHTLADFTQPTVRLDVTQWADAKGFYHHLGFRRAWRRTPPPKPPLAYGITLKQTALVLHRDSRRERLGRDVRKWLVH